MVRLFTRTFIERDRCWHVTLLFSTIKDVLVQALLLLRHQSFLECQFVVEELIVKELLVQEPVDIVAANLIVLHSQVFLTFNLFTL